MLIDIMHTVTSALQVPVVVLLMVFAVVMVVLVGMLVAEFFTERRYFKLSIPELVDSLHHSDDPEGVVRNSGMLRRQKGALFELLNHPDASASERESMAVNIVAQERAIFDNRVKVTDFLAKVGPMFGLMGTLIPLGPGIIAIGMGDTQTLSDSLLVAFDTTITGLVVAALALLVSTVRKAWYVKYNAAFAAACEIVLEKANEGATLNDATSDMLARQSEKGRSRAFGSARSSARRDAGRSSSDSSAKGDAKRPSSVDDSTHRGAGRPSSVDDFARGGAGRPSVADDYARGDAGRSSSVEDYAHGDEGRQLPSRDSARKAGDSPASGLAGAADSRGDLDA